MARATQAIIDLKALVSNYQLAQQAAPQSQAYAVIKANAYGHGLLEAANALSPVAKGFAVACVEEAQQLRDAGIQTPILVLEGVMDALEYQLAQDLDLELALHNHEQLTWLKGFVSATGQKPKVIRIKVDSGMHRLGLPADQVFPVLTELQDLSIERITLMSHFACADEPARALNQEQLTIMDSLTSLNLPMSFCNSAALLAYDDLETNTQLLPGDMVRPGIMLYGSSPFVDKDKSAETLGLKPVMTLKSKVIAVNQVKAGESIGYGQTHVTDKVSTIAVVAIGYGDGYPRSAKNGTPVLINGETYPLAGRVSMDMITVDVTGSNAGASVKVGDTVTLWGQGLDSDVVARHCGTISYELFCQITNRVQRTYGS